jgi:hypothetical protein
VAELGKEIGVATLNDVSTKIQPPAVTAVWSAAASETVV